jgi:hypothetical protein
VQNAVKGVVKEQKQPLAQGWLALQRPLQVVVVWTPLSNCFAEIVPALRTANTMIANKKVWIFFFTTSPFS